MKQYITIDNSVHAVMVAFAFASVTNVFSYFAGAGHDWLASAFMAVALGTALATSAIMATKINMRKEATSFWSVLAMVLVIGLVSGYVQTQGYIAHGVAVAQARIMGFGVPLAGEFLLALALAIYTGAIKRTKIHEADTAMEVRVSEAIADVLSAVDVSSAAKYVERKISTIIRHKADEVLSRYIPPAPDMEEEMAGDATNADLSTSEMTPEKAAKGRQSRTRIAQEGQAQLERWLIINAAGSSVDQLNKSAIGREFDIDPRTVGRWIDAIWERNGWNGRVPEEA